MVYRYLYCLFGYRDALQEGVLYRVVVTMRLCALDGGMRAHVGYHADVLEFELGFDASWQTISMDEARQMMAELDEFVLLDVRESHEFVQGHLDGSILIPYHQIINRATYELPCKDIPIFIYCQRGRRSAIAARILAELGYANVHDIGGLD